MTNAYKFTDLLNNVSNPTIQNAKYCEINDLQTTPMRVSDILIQPSESNFEPYVPESKTHTVTLRYPIGMSLTYEGTTLSKTLTQGMAKSSIVVPETQDGYDYYPIINYSPKSKTNLYNGSYGSIQLNKVTQDRTLVIYYVYDFKVTGSEQVSYITINDSSESKTLPYEQTGNLQEMKIKVFVADGYQVLSVVGTYCKVVPTGNANEYKIQYTGDKTQVATVNILTEEKQTENSYYNVNITGLQKANVVYNSTILDEIDGQAAIANIADGSSVSITVSADTNYFISKISVNGVATSYSNTTTKQIDVAISGADVQIDVETVLSKAQLVIPQNDYVESITVNTQKITPTESKTILVTADAENTIVFEFDSLAYKLTSVSSSSGTISKQSDTTYVLTTDSTTENVTLNYTVAQIEKKTVTFKNAENVTVKKGSVVLDTTSGVYSEQFTTGSSVIYTISANSGYTLDNVSLNVATSKYTYSNGTLTIPTISDDIIVSLNVSAQQAATRIMLELVNKDGNVNGAIIGTAPYKKDFNQSSMEKSLTGEAINVFYDSLQPFSISTTTGKKVKSVVCSEGGAVYGDNTDGYTFKLTSKSIEIVTITIETMDESEEPAEVTTYTVQFKGAENAVLYNNGSILPYSVVGSDTVYFLDEITSGSNISVTVALSDTDKYEFYSIPTVSTGAITWNSSTGTLSISNVTSDIVVQLYIRTKQDENVEWDGSAAFYEDNSKYSSSIYWNKNNNGYEYSKVLSGTSILAVTTAWWICLEYQKNCKYLIETSYSNVQKIYLCYSETSKTASAMGQAIAQRVELTSDQFKKVDNGYEIPAKYITQSDKYKYIYFAFYRKESSTDKFVISDVKYSYSTISTESAFSSSGFYRSNVVSNFQYINECDPTAQKIPYSSLSFDVYDESNMFVLTDLTQLKIGNTGADSNIKGAPYNIYALCAEITENSLPSDKDYYIVQIGRMYLDSITHNNDYTTFEFIGTLEKYDNIFLSSAEKRLSSYLKKVNVRDYVKQLFGTDVDESGIPEYFTALTPFDSESKSEILRVLCDYCNMTMFEGANGKIKFSTDILANTPITFAETTEPYKLLLDNCFNFPQYEQTKSQYDSINVEVFKRIINSSGKVFQNADFQMFVKTVEPSESESWQGDNDWKLLLKTSGNNSYFYDNNGREYVLSSNLSSDANVNFLNIANTYGEIKYIKFDVEFQNPVTDLRFYSSSLIDDKNPVNGLNAEDFHKYFCGTLRSFFFDWLMESTAQGVDFYVSEKRFEFFAKFPIVNNPNYGISSLQKYSFNYGYIDIFSENAVYLGTPSEILLKYSGSDVPATIDYAEILWDMFFSVWATIMDSKAKEITTASRNYSYKPYGTNNNMFSKSNNLIDSFAEAIWCSSIGLQKINSDSIEVLLLDWKGNGLIELADNILFEHSTGREVNRKYNKFYCGKVKKFVYNFDGALSVDTTLALVPKDYYESVITGDKVQIFPSPDTKFVDGKVEFSNEIK